MNALIDNPAALLAAMIVLALVFSITSFGLILTSGHQNNNSNYRPNFNKPVVKKYGIFDKAVKVDGIVYYHEPASDCWLAECILHDIEHNEAKKLTPVEMDHKPWLADKH
ncbi:MAG: hypothetical protein ACI846_000134 [Pseudoalteromonas distincta]|jgi:hypothetical protein